MFYTACFLVIDIKLNETSLSFYRYHNKGIPSATPEGEYRGTFTKTDTGTLQYKPVDQSFKSECMSVSYITVMSACAPGKGYLTLVCKIIYLNIRLHSQGLLNCQKM